VRGVVNFFLQITKQNIHHNPSFFFQRNEKSKGIKEQRDRSIDYGISLLLFALCCCWGCKRA